MDYNLLNESWIPVLWKDGHSGRVGIVEALTEGHRIRQIAAANPMDRVAILRFLLALLYWCNRDAPYDKDSLSAFWFKKLKEKEECFDLLGKENSFYQDHAGAGKPVAATNLLHDLPSGSNIAHFRHLRDFRDGLCLACCAMGLLRWATVASAGTKGPYEQMTASINGNSPAYSIRMGATLLKTLCCNWPVSNPIEGDAPLWDGAWEESQLGLLKGMTWQSRRILLAPPDAGGNRDFSAGKCCYCGEPTDRLVKSIVFRPGWQRPYKEPWWGDPHLLWVTTKYGKGKEKKNVPSWPGPNDPLEDHANTWRNVLKGLLQRLISNRADPAQLETMLIATNQELYKHVEILVAILPTLAPSTAQDLLNELECLRQLIWSAVSARTRDWHKRPRGHAVIEALCSTAAKGHAIRSSLCAASFIAEKELEQAFAKLIQALASADQNDNDPAPRALGEWRNEVGRILRRDVGQVTDLTTRGSPLRKREAKDRAIKAVLSAESRLSMRKEEAKQ